MPTRSLLFVPGDSEKKLAKAETTNADVLILDLEDSVSANRAELARGIVRDYLLANPPETRTKGLWVRVNALDHDAALADIVAAAAGRPDAILQPKTRSGSDVALLANYLTALEQRDGFPLGGIKIVPVATETPESVLGILSYRGCSPRLAGLTWGAEDLAAALQATTNRLPDGEYEHTYRMARSACLLGARAAGVEPIDTIWGNFRDPEGLAADAAAARRAGFSGKVAIHPDQIEIINAAFTPSEEEVFHARRVVAAFEAQGTGTVGLDGKMLDMPHLKQARIILAAAGA